MEKDFAGVLKGCWILIISIHSLAWRKTTDYSSLLKKVTISIHSLAWRKTNCICIYIFRLEFQSTLSHGERHLLAISPTCSGLFQSTLSHGERHYNTKIIDFGNGISIHSLAWRKTLLF